MIPKKELKSMKKKRLTFSMMYIWKRLNYKISLLMKAQEASTVAHTKPMTVSEDISWTLRNSKLSTREKYLIRLVTLNMLNQAAILITMNSISRQKVSIKKKSKFFGIGVETQTNWLLRPMM